MRARDIKPGFYTNEQLAECSPWARLIFPGLWMVADRCGRLEYRPKKLKAELLPYDGEDMAALIDELVAHGLVVIYEHEGAKYLWIPTFSKHQKPHPNEKTSALPACPCEEKSHQGDKQDAPRCEASTTLVNKDTSSKGVKSGLLSLSSSSLLPEEEKTEGGISRAFSCIAEDCVDPPAEDTDPASKPKRTDCPSKGNPEWAGFQSCFEVFPVQQGKEAAWNEWMRLHTNGTLATTWEIRDAILLLKAEDTRWQRGKVPKMARWLAEKGWDDKPFVEPTEAARASPQSNRPQTAAQEKRALMAQNSQDVLKSREALRNDPQSPYSHGIGGNVRALPPAEAG